MIDQSLQALLQGCRRGQESAQQAFYERYYSYALSICLAYASNPEDAREILNDSFLKAFRHLDALKQEDALLPWLRRILVNTALDYYRRSRQRATAIPLEEVAGELVEPYLNEAAILAQLSVEHILTVLHQLPVPYRLVFSLYVLEGYTHSEIAQRLGIAESTARSHLSEANRRLRQALKAQIHPTHERTNR